MTSRSQTVDVAAPDDQPSAACILREHLRLDVETEVVAAELEAGYATGMWEPGG